MNFYDNLKMICEEKGVKVTPTVLKCGGTKGILSGWKKGVFPNSEIVMNLSVLLSVPTDRLLFGEERSHLPELTEERYYDNGFAELKDIYINLSEREKGELIGYARRMYEYSSLKTKENA